MSGADSSLSAPRGTLSPHEQLQRSRRRLRALECHLEELGYHGEAYALANIVGDLSLAIARLTARIRIAAWRSRG